MELVKIKRIIISVNVLVVGKDEIVKPVSGKNNGDDDCGGECQITVVKVVWFGDVIIIQ